MKDIDAAAGRIIFDYAGAPISRAKQDSTNLTPVGDGTTRADLIKVRTERSAQLIWIEPAPPLWENMRAGQLSATNTASQYAKYP